MPRNSSHAIEEIPYRLRWLAGGLQPGSHRSRVIGAGDRFFGAAPLVQGRDARRLELRASALDPFGRPWVREFQQRSRVPVLLLADLSRSMTFIGGTDRLLMTARFAGALARAAFRRSDPFGFFGADRRLRRELMILPTVSRRAGEQVAARLQRVRQSGGLLGGATGLLEVPRWLPRQRSLLFLLTDGHLDSDLVVRLLRSLSSHQVVMVLLHDSAERQPPARWGLVRLADLESGQERMMLLRPGLADRMAAESALRIAELIRIARRYGASVLQVEDELDLTAVARHFLAEGTA